MRESAVIGVSWMVLSKGLEISRLIRSAAMNVKLMSVLAIGVINVWNRLSTAFAFAPLLTAVA